MRKTMTIILTVLAALALLLSGCDPILPSGEKSVKFSATAKSQMTTKTSYAGDDYTSGKTHEDIYWSDGDAISIYSSNTNIVATPNGSASAEYLLDVVEGTPTHAKLVNSDPNGLAWKASGAVKFYAVYPPSTLGNGESGYFTMGIPTTQEYATSLAETNMDHAYMLAINSLESLTENVSLNFYPAFSAFQINLGSLDSELTLKEFRIYYEDPVDPEDAAGKDIRLSGPYYGQIDENHTLENNTMDFARCDETTEVNKYKEPTYDFSQVRMVLDGTTISPDSYINFTLLTLPFMGGKNIPAVNGLTNLWLEVSFTKENETTVVKKKLALKQGTGFIQFAPCKKYRINGLAVDGGSKWKLNIKADVLDWTFYDEPLSSLNQINVNPIDDDNHTVKVTGSIETTSKWLEDHPDTGSNHELPNDVPEDDPSYYARYYQVRTLNWSQAPEKQFFEMSFTPTAPIGGYWQMIPEYPDQSSRGHFRFEVKIEDLTGWEEQDVPHAQIIDKRVFIRIYPVYENDDDHIYEMTLKCYFSPNKSFDPTYSADSELQDVHRKGDFSYWRFRLERYAGGPYTVSTADEHESLKPRN
ncbi:MAG: hypothetical protein IKQ01_01155 [Bacteroidales bacterium]|nr:hypothetical protein [Bacteroidales bacterium]